MRGHVRAVAPGSSPGQALRGSPGSSPGSLAPQGDGSESVLASVSTARSVGCLLDRRAGNRPVGAEHAAVARQGLEHFTTAFARIEEPARIRGHAFGRLVPAFRTGDGGFLDHLIASGLTGEPTAPVIGIAGPTNMNS